MRIVLTGATGFIGRALTARLVTEGHEVTALVRTPESAADLAEAHRCTLKQWDARTPIDPDFLADQDAVIHLLGEPLIAKRWNPGIKAAIRESRVNGTRTLVQAIAALPEKRRPRVFISASAVGFYGDRAEQTLYEDSPAGTGFLAEVASAWEKEAFGATASGCRVVALRLGIVLGGSQGRPGGALRKMPPVVLGSGRQWMSWIHLEDLLSLIGFALANAAVRGPINAVSPGPVRAAEFARRLARAKGLPFALGWTPAWALRLALGEMADAPLSSQRALPKQAAALGFSFKYPDLESALAQVMSRFSKTKKRVF